MSVYAFVDRENPMLDRTEHELRQDMAAEDRIYAARWDGTVGIDLKRMSQDLEPQRFRRYVNICRALRQLTRIAKTSAAA